MKFLDTPHLSNYNPEILFHQKECMGLKLSLKYLLRDFCSIFVPLKGYLNY